MATYLYGWGGQLMARRGRIRSIKPEFWTDGKNKKLSDSCALFFIALWNFCDDEGKIENDVHEIKNVVCRWTVEKIRHFISSLLASGQLAVSLDSAWLLVVNWNHQKISRPSQPKIKNSDIQWLTASHSMSGDELLTEDSTKTTLGSGSGFGSRIYSPRTPRKRGEPVVLVTKIIGALRRYGSLDLDDEKAAEAERLAREAIGETGWRILGVKFPTWREFVKDYTVAYRADRATVYEAQLTRTIRALLPEFTAPQGEQADRSVNA